MWETRKFKETAVNTLIESVETFGIDNGDNLKLTMDILNVREVLVSG